MLIQSFRNLAPNSTPSFAGLRLKADGQEPLRKHVITDTHEHEFYDLTGDPNAYELDNLVCTNPSGVDDHRTEIAAARGLVITIDDPSVVYWDLPMGIPGEEYSVTIKAEGGEGPYSWCLWEFTDDAQFSHCQNACGDSELGCLFEDVTPHDPKKEKTDPDCLCVEDPEDPDDRPCPCVCGLPEDLEFAVELTQPQDKATIFGTYPQSPGACYEFVVGVIDDSVSPYTGEHQKYLRRFRIQTGFQLDTSPDGYDTYIPEDGEAPACGVEKLIVSKDDTGSNDGNVALLRFERPADFGGNRYLATSGKLILLAADPLLDATLYYVEDQDPVNPACKMQYASFPDCNANSKPDWADWEALEGKIVPITRFCSIGEDQYVRFDITPYLTQLYLNCADQIPYYQFVITSNETASGRGFHGSDSDFPPRLAFTHSPFSTVSENTNAKCRNCKDDNCDGDVDCADGNCCDKADCPSCSP